MITKGDLEKLGFRNAGVSDIAEILRQVNPRCPDLVFFDSAGDRRHYPLSSIENGDLLCLGRRNGACVDCQVRVPCYEVETDHVTFWRFPVSDVKYIKGPGAK